MGKNSKRYKKERLGQRFITKEGFEIEIIEYITSKNISVRIVGEDIVIKNKSYHNIVSGYIKNPYNKIICNLGFIGQGSFKSTLNRHSYNIWRNMLIRCYTEKQPTYKDVTVVEEWHNFQNFAQWFEENYKPEYMKGWHLDKDILIKGNKIYSPETCCFVPAEINTVFVKPVLSKKELPIGVQKRGSLFRATLQQGDYLGSYSTPEEAFQAYKIAKEKYIKEVADKWKDLIDPIVYEVMYNYKVEITD